MIFPIAIFLCAVIATSHGETGIFPLLMPNSKPSQPETYFCTPVRIDYSKNFYITEFLPNATSDVAHHILIYGCEKPGTNKKIWNCGEMAVKDSNFQSAPPCQSGSQIVYAWAHHAPKLELPKGVGFKVGGDSPIQYLVLQVHYATVDKFKDGSTDQSGVLLQYTDVPQPRTAGVLLMGTNGRIKGNSVEHMETACTLNEKVNKVVHPFAFRTHTHKLGTVVSGYKVEKTPHEGNKWTLIGKRDPQLPQMFYPIQKKTELTLQNGDIVAARCTMDARTRKRNTYIGPTADDEMCNFYMMYWVEGPDTLDQKYCFSLGPPVYYWSSFYSGLNNIPDADASNLD